MNMAQFAIARTYQQLIEIKSKRRLTEKERSLFRVVRAAVDRYAKEEMVAA